MNLLIKLKFSLNNLLFFLQNLGWVYLEIIFWTLLKVYLNWQSDIWISQTMRTYACNLVAVRTQGVYLQLRLHLLCLGHLSLTIYLCDLFLLCLSLFSMLPFQIL